MPHTSDLGQNVIWEGNNGEKWIVKSSTTEPEEILVTLVRLKVVEKLELEKET